MVAEFKDMTKIKMILMQTLTTSRIESEVKELQPSFFLKGDTLMRFEKKSQYSSLPSSNKLKAN